VKYGDSSLITTIFTAADGIQAYMVQGVCSSKTGKNRAAFFQPGMLLELVVYEHSQKKLHRIREFSAAYIYCTIQESVVKNSIVLFSAELLLRLLPEHAPMPWLFDLASEYFISLDKMRTEDVANFPLFFIQQCSRALGYDLSGHYSPDTPHINIQDGGFTGHAPSSPPYLDSEDTKLLDLLLNVQGLDELKHLEMNSPARFRLIDWYIVFLKEHTQYMGNIRSLPVLRTILH
jgi:DNA repair protein RecO (recombination protein O)